MSIGTHKNAGRGGGDIGGGEGGGRMGLVEEGLLSVFVFMLVVSPLRLKRDGEEEQEEVSPHVIVLGCSGIVD